MSKEVEIKLCQGGYFVCFEEGNGWSGPWRTEEAAKLARAGKYEAAHKANRIKPSSASQYPSRAWQQRTG